MDELDELSLQRNPDKHDADAPLARDQATWFARELSEEWQAVEPGIYRYVGGAEATSETQATDGR